MENNHKMLNNVAGSKTFDRPGSAQLVAARQDATRTRLQEVDAPARRMIEAATVPAICGPDIPAAPARGAFQVIQFKEVVPGSSGTARPAGYRGEGEATFRSAIIVADVFDKMIHAEWRSHVKRGGEAIDFVSPFTPGQVSMARDYRDLVAWRNAGGVKCSDLSRPQGGGTKDPMDRFRDAGRELAKIEARIGDGVAAQVKRVRPSARGAGARALITDRVLVDMVCLSECTISDVLRHYRWTLKGSHREALRRALAAALDRMQGYK